MTFLRHPMVLGGLGWAVLMVAAVRDEYFWGSGEVLGIGLHHLLGIAEGVALLLFAGLAGTSWVMLVRGAADTATRKLVGYAVLLTVVAVVIPPFLSTDVYDYVARGRVEAVYGANPYTTAIGEFPGDPLLEHAEWPDHVLPYGPLTALLQLAVAHLAGTSALVGALLFKLVFAGCHLAIGGLLHATAAPEDPGRARRLFVLWTINPFLLLELVVNAHNEAAMALGLAVAAWGAARDRWCLGTLGFGAAMLFKHGCAPVGVLLLACAWNRRRVRPFLTGTALALAGAVGLVWWYFRDENALAFMADQLGVIRGSVQTFAAAQLGEGAAAVVRYTGYAATLIALGVCWRRCRDAGSLALCTTVVMLLFLCLAMGQFTPWYHLWWLPVAVLGRNTRLDVLLVAITLGGPASYLVHATFRVFGPEHQAWQWTLAFAIPVAAATLFPRDLESPLRE